MLVRLWWKASPQYFTKRINISLAKHISLRMISGFQGLSYEFDKFKVIASEWLEFTALIS